MNIELIQNFCSVQGYDELYNPEDSDVLEEEDMTVDDGIKHCSYIFIVLVSKLMALLHECHSCGLLVTLYTFIIGTLLVVNGKYTDGH